MYVYLLSGSLNSLYRMIGLEEWRAKIGTHHGGLSRVLARTPGNSRLAWIHVSDILLILFACLLPSLWNGPHTVATVCLRRCENKAGLSRLLCWMTIWTLSVSALSTNVENLERSIAALAILLIISGDVEQNPGPIGMLINTLLIIYHLFDNALNWLSF